MLPFLKRRIVGSPESPPIAAGGIDEHIDLAEFRSDLFRGV